MRTACSWLLLISLIAPVSVQAQTRDTTQIAQAGFEEGAKAYLAGRYEEAIVTWQKAYEIWPAAIILYNMSLAASKLGNPHQAHIYAQQAAQNTDVPLEAEYRVKNLANQRAWEAGFIARDLAQEVRRRNPIEPAMDIGWAGYAGAGMATVGVGLLIGSIVVGAEAADDNAALALVDERDVYDQQRSELEDVQSTGRLLLYSGAGLAAAGAGLLVWDLFFTYDRVQLAGGTAADGGYVLHIGGQF